MTLQEIIDRVNGAIKAHGYSETDKQRDRLDRLERLLLDLEIAQRRERDRDAVNGVAGA